VTTEGERIANAPRSVNRIRRAPTSEQVSEHIRLMIFEGALRPGERVPQDAIAAELGVSRIPVREALIEMARDGLVVNEPHIGTFVGPFDEQVIRDHFEIVAMLQGMAAERLAALGDPDVLAQLRALAEQIAASDDPTTVNDSSIEFQRTVNRGGGSARLRAVLRALGRMFPTGIFFGIEGAVEIQKRAVAGMVEAIESGSGPRIREQFLQANRERADLLITQLRRVGTLT
jgi:DNA-binding GntR family transcriptional regulator